jgi:hypothetical protein
MIGSRVLGAAVAALLISSLGVMAGCSSEEKDEATSAKTIQAASVNLVLHDENGTRIGTGAGILLSPRMVLTSGHLVAGMTSWTVTSADGKTKVNGVRGQTYDWMVYNSNLSHPRKHDVGVIYLDRPINLDHYPRLAADKAANGTKGARIRGNGGEFAMQPAVLNKYSSFPNAYLTDMPKGETLNTGTAVLNDKNEIVGLVTGRGMQTGKLHVARTNELVQWLTPKVSCGSTKNNDLALRTYSTPPPKEGCEDKGGATGSTPGSGTGTNGGGSNNLPGGGGSSSTPGTGTGTSGGNGGPGSSGTVGSSGVVGGGGGGADDIPGFRCETGGGREWGFGGSNTATGVPNGNVGGGTGGAGGIPWTPGQWTPGTNSGSASVGSSGSAGQTSGGPAGSSGGGAGSTGTSGGNAGTSGGGSNAGTSGSSSNTGGNTGIPGGGAGTSVGSGSNGGQANGSGTLGSSGPESNGAGPGGGGAGAGSSVTGNNGLTFPSGEGEQCGGASDNPEICPVEDDGAWGPSVGGAFTFDNNIDYTLSGPSVGGVGGKAPDSDEVIVN